VSDVAASPCLIRAAEAKTLGDGHRLSVREGELPGFGIALRFQDPRPAGPATAGCVIGHSVLATVGRLRYAFDDHSVEACPGDMPHAPAGPAHHHKPCVVSEGPVPDVLTEFADTPAAPH
jgi:hypothetical protein